MESNNPKDATQQSVHLTGGILRHFRALSTPEQNPALKVLSTPTHPQVTQTVSPLFINHTIYIKNSMSFLLCFVVPSAIFLGCISGFIKDRFDVQAQKETNYKQIIKAIVIGVLVSLEAGLASGALVIMFSMFVGATSTWLAPVLHIPATWGIPKSINEGLAIGSLPLFFGLYFGAFNGVHASLYNDILYKEVKIYQLGFGAIFACMFIFIIMPTSFVLLRAGWYILANSQCDRDPKIHGSIIFLLSLLSVQLVAQWIPSINIFTSWDKENFISKIFAIGTMFSLLAVLDTLILC